MTSAKLPQPAGKGNQEPRPPWQVLPALSEAEFAELKADIAQRGIVVPVVVDADSGLIVDGQHRVRAWEQLRSEGRRLPDYPRDVRRFASDAERLSFSVAANLFRRHLSRTQRAEVVAELRERGWSLRKVSDVLGVHHETVRRDLEIVADATIPDRVERQGGATYPGRRPKTVPSIVVRSARDERRAREALAALGDEAPGTDLRRAEEKARLAALARRRAGDVPVVSEGPGWEIRTGDFREVLADIPDKSVDAIVTDPPYNVEGIPLYSDLSAFAARVLKPGRLCVAYCGKMALPEHFERLGEHLEYVWTGAIFLPGRHTIFRRKMIFGRWRPVAFFSAGPYEIRTTLVDALWSEGNGEKSSEDHPWQQAIPPFERLIEMATRQGELVVDPFLGSGTTALASLACDRRLIGADVDPGAVSQTLQRLCSRKDQSQAVGSPPAQRRPR